MEHKGGHYKRDKDKDYLTEQYEKKVKKLKRYDETNQLRWQKAIAETVKVIIAKDSKILSNKDYEQISKVYYGKCTKLNTVSTKRKMTSQIAKEQINAELRRILNDAGLQKEHLSEIYKDALSFAKEKKDVTNLLKIAERIERANNLTDSPQNTPKEQHNYQVNFNEFRKETTKTDDFSQIQASENEQGQDENTPNED